MDHKFVVQSSDEGHLSSFHDLAIVDKASMNIVAYAPYFLNGCRIMSVMLVEGSSIQCCFLQICTWTCNNASTFTWIHPSL